MLTYIIFFIKLANFKGIDMNLNRKIIENIPNRKCLQN